MISRQQILLPALFILVFFLTGSPLLFAVEGKEIHLSFSKAVETALLNNPDIKSTKAEIERKEADKQHATALFMPKVDIYTDYIRGDSPSASLFTAIDQRELEPDTDFNNPGEFENFESGVRASMMLFNGGKDILERKAADDFLNAARAESKSVINSITADVMKGWFNILSAKRFTTIAEDSIETIQKQLEIMTIRFKGGSVLKSDILALKVRLAEAEEERIKNKSRISLAKATLAVLLGLSPENTLLIDRSKNDFSSFEQYVTQSLKAKSTTRPEIIQAEKMVLGTKKASNTAKRFYTPTIQLAGKYYLDDEEMRYSRERENWTLGVMMNLNLFSGMTNTAKKKKASANLISARQTKKKTELNVQLDIKKSTLMLEEAVARLKVSEKNKELAEESLMLVKKQYDGGAVSITRYLDAELAYSRAKSSLATVTFDKMVAIVETARANGLLADPGFIIKK